MKKTKKVIIYGGAFNPPTKAHQTILQALIDTASKNKSEVWLVPSGERPDKAIGITTSTRLALCRALVKSVKNLGVTIKLITFELESATETNTLESYRYLANKYPNHTFAWVFGSDSLQTMHTWPGGEQLSSSLRMLIIQRPGYTLPPLPPHAEVLQVTTLKVSSTEVREKLINGDSIEHIVPSHVAKLLLSSSLY